MRRGFTLVETIFSSLFIGVTVLAIINLFPGAYLSIRQSESTLQADLVAKSVLDELRSTLNLNPAAGLPNGPYTGSGPAFAPRAIEGIVYTPEVELFDVPGMESSSTTLRGARVIVTFRLHLSEKKVIHETYLHSMTIRRGGFHHAMGPKS